MVGWHQQLNGHDFEQTLETVNNKQSWHAAVQGVTRSWTRQQLNTGKSSFPTSLSTVPFS